MCLLRKFVQFFNLSSKRDKIKSFLQMIAALCETEILNIELARRWYKRTTLKIWTGSKLLVCLYSCTKIEMYPRGLKISDLYLSKRFYRTWTHESDLWSIFLDTFNILKVKDYAGCKRLFLKSHESDQHSAAIFLTNLISLWNVF